MATDNVTQRENDVGPDAVFPGTGKHFGVAEGQHESCLVLFVATILLAQWHRPRFSTAIKEATSCLFSNP